MENLLLYIKQYQKGELIGTPVKACGTPFEAAYKLYSLNYNAGDYSFKGVLYSVDFDNEKLVRVNIPEISFSGEYLNTNIK